MMRLPSLSRPAHLTRAQSLDEERRTPLRSESGVTERHSMDCPEGNLGGGSEGVSSMYNALSRGPARSTLKRGKFGSYDSFDLDHVYNNWPSA
jgi:hypothetical protein